MKEFRCLSTREAAARLKMSTSNLGNMLRWGKIRGVKVRGFWCVPLTEVRRLQAQRRRRAKRGRKTLIHQADRPQPRAWTGPEHQILLEGLALSQTHRRISESLQAAGFSRSVAAIGKEVKRLRRGKRPLPKPEIRPAEAQLTSGYEPSEAKRRPQLSQPEGPASNAGSISFFVVL